MGDHSETIQIDYDPTRVSYAELLELFWRSHRPTSPAWSRQYMSIIFYHDEEQKRLAFETKAREAARLGSAIYTEIVPAGRFTWAEDYHQKYYLSHYRDLMQEVRRIYPTLPAFVNSTAAARLNGYAGGNGSKAQLDAELESLGLSPAASEEVLRLVSGGLE